MGALRALTLLAGGHDRPAVILVHGAANSGRVWTFWQSELARHGWTSHAIDLRGHGASEVDALGTTSMADYADDVVTFARTLRRPPVLVGWSMGGLVAMMAAAMCEAQACVGLAPSAATKSRDRSIPLRAGVFGAEEYGIVNRDSDRQTSMADLDGEERAVALKSLGLESRMARDERKAGIVIASLPCPVLIVTGTADMQWPRQRYSDLPFAADHVEIGDASHWGLVLNRRVLPEIGSVVCSWLEKRRLT
jgi:pimeloyl-ACP methyl ester carboxylesterase